ncbi:MAG: ferrous iron transport protein B [Clostridia bacterium]
MKIALVGNQNCGKTTLFNLLTGTNQKIGNWPGVTIERKVGKIKDLEDDLVDLPGIYSLSPYTVEEEVSRKFVLEEKPNIIINIVDATSIERSLYLTTQLMELDTKVIIALNMADRLEKKGIHIDEKKLSQELGTDVVIISALKATGIEELKNTIRKCYNKKAISKEIFKSDIENEIVQIRNEFKTNRFIAIKILENDKLYQNYQKGSVKNSRQRLEEIYKMDIEEIIANARYEYIVKIKNKSTTITPIKETMSDKLDKIFLNKFLAFPIFIGIMFLVYYLSVGVVGSFTVDWISKMVGNFGEIVRTGLTNLGASNWSTSLVVDGIIAGVGAVLGFVPQLIILFLCISILETTGYMSRVTFLLDKLFKKFGLSGETLVPFIVGLRMLSSSNNVNKNNKRQQRKRAIYNAYTIYSM